MLIVFYREDLQPCVKVFANLCLGNGNKEKTKFKHNQSVVIFTA